MWYLHIVASIPCLDSLGQTIASYGTEDYCITYILIHCLQLQCIGEAAGAHRFLPPTLAGHTHSQQS